MRPIYVRELGAFSVFANDWLQPTNTIVSMSGSGNAYVNVNGALNANVTGSGSIRYSGNPTNIIQSKTGSRYRIGHI